MMGTVNHFFFISIEIVGFYAWLQNQNKNELG